MTAPYYLTLTSEQRQALSLLMTYGFDGMLRDFPDMFPPGLVAQQRGLTQAARNVVEAFLHRDTVRSTPGGLVDALVDLRILSGELFREEEPSAR